MGKGSLQLVKGGMQMKVLYWLGAVPFVAILGGVIWANRVTPFVFGMPFILFWIVLWVVLTTVIMYVIYRLDPANRGGDRR